MSKMFSPSRLERVRIECLDKERITLGCKKCGAKWFPMIQTGGKLHRGWWKCPEGCNSHIKNIDRPDD